MQNRHFSVYCHQCILYDFYYSIPNVCLFNLTFYLFFFSFSVFLELIVDYTVTAEFITPASIVTAVTDDAATSFTSSLAAAFPGTVISSTGAPVGTCTSVLAIIAIFIFYLFLFLGLKKSDKL